jgi:preprotein translocase subunit SecD
MLEKLISLLLHAKAGAISGVFLLGATGALVSVSTQNGVTTITLTDPSPSPSAQVSAPAREREVVTTPTPTPTESPTASPLASPRTALAVTPACTDEAKAISLQVQRVDTAFSGFHGDLVKLKGLRDRATLEKADDLLKSIRQSAVRAIHATATQACAKVDDDEDMDEDVNDDKNNDNNDEDVNDDHKNGAAPIVFTGTAAAIADQAIAAMQTAFDAAKNAPAVTTNSTKKSETTKSANSSNQPKASDDHKGKGVDNKGKGEHRD